MKNCFAVAQRNEECGLLFLVKEKVIRILHSSFFILHFSFFIQNRFFLHDPSVILYEFVAEAAA